MASKDQALAILLLSLLSLASFSLGTSISLPVLPPCLGGGNPLPTMAPPPRNPPPMMAPPPRNPPPMMAPPPRNPPPMMAPPPRNPPPPRSPPPMIPPPPSNTCPKNTTELKVCVGLLNLVKLTVNIPPNDPARDCCSLIQGLVDLEATLCLCVAAKPNLLQIINLQTTISLALNVCNRNVPPNAIKCPNN